MGKDKNAFSLVYFLKIDASHDIMGLFHDIVGFFL